MIKNDKYYEATISLLLGLFTTVLGVLLLIFNKKLYVSVIKILVIIILLNSIIQLAYHFLKKNYSNNLLKCFINLFSAIILLLIPSIPRSIFPFLVGVYLLFYGLIKIIICVVSKKDNVVFNKIEIIESIILFILSIIVFLKPLENLNIILFVTSLYFIILGSSFILNFIFRLLPNKYKRRIKINLPIFIEIFIPYTFLMSINKTLEYDDNIKKIVNKSNSNRLEILVHVAKNGFNRLGHVDIILDDIVYSYGNYDYNSRKFYEISGDGVIFKAPKKEYINLCIEYSDKMLFGFGINLTDNELNSISEKLNTIMADCIKWKLDSKVRDYTYYLQHKASAKFYKFREGKFKTYLVFNTNCCYLANEIISNSDKSILKMNGIITPGTYYDRLNREFINKTGIVTYRNIYTKQTINSYFE